MKSIVAVMVLVFMAVLLTLGTSSVMAQGKGKATSAEAMAKCDEGFKSLDVGNKGYLTQEQIVEDMYGHSHKGTGPTHKGESVFTGMDTNKDGKVTKDEYCAWKNK